MDTKENYKSNFFIQFGYFISRIGIIYKYEGLIKTFKYIGVSFLMSIIKWFYNHTKWGNTLIKRKINKNIPKDSKILLSDIMFSNKPIDYKGFYDSLSDDKKEEYHKLAEEIIQKSVKEYGIEDEKQINEFRKMFNFEQ